MNLCKKGIIPVNSDCASASLPTTKFLLINSDNDNEDDIITNYFNDNELSKPNLITGSFGGSHSNCYRNTYTKKKNEDLEDEEKRTNLSDINILCRRNKPLKCSRLVRSLSVRTRQKHRIRPQATGNPYYSSEGFENILTNLTNVNKLRSVSDPTNLACLYPEEKNVSDRRNTHGFTNINNRSFKGKGQKNYSNMDFILTSNADILCSERNTMEGQTVTEDALSVQVQHDLETLALVDNSTDNKVEEMTCIPAQSLVDRASAAMLTSPSLSPSSDNCIMCRLGCQHVDPIQNNGEHYGMHIIEDFDKTNTLDTDILPDTTTKSHQQRKSEKQEQHNNPYFLVRKETSGASGEAIDDEGCFLSSLTPTNTSTKNYYNNCTVNITNSSMFTNVKINDHEGNMTNEPETNVRGDDINSSSTSNPNNNIVSTTSRSSFSERCSSSDVDSGRVSDTDTGTTSSTNSSNHIGDDQKYERCLIQAPENCIITSSKSQRIKLVANEVRDDEVKGINSESIPDNNNKTETNVTHTSSSRSPQMVHIVSHSFCDFLGTLPGAESRGHKSKSSRDSERSQKHISDNSMSDHSNGNIATNHTVIHNHLSKDNFEVRDEGELASESQKYHSHQDSLKKNCQHNQNKVTVFVPYSTIIRCMNETMDRKRKAKKIFENGNIGGNESRMNGGMDSNNDSKKSPFSNTNDNVAHDNQRKGMVLHSTGSASCVGIVVGGDESVHNYTDKRNNIQANDQERDDNVALLNSNEGNNKLYSKRMTKRLQQYNNNKDGYFENKKSCENNEEESEGVNPCMLMLTEDSEELILPSPPPFPTSTTTPKVTNYDEIIRHELLQDSDAFLDQIRKNKHFGGHNKDEGEFRRNGVGIPRRKDLCKLLGLNERNVGELLIVPDEKVKLAQKVALLHKCNIAPTPNRQQHDVPCHPLYKQYDLGTASTFETSAQVCSKNNGKPTNEVAANNIKIKPEVFEGKDKKNFGINGAVPTIKETENEAIKATGNENNENSLIIPQRKKSKNLAKFFGVEDEDTPNSPASNQNHIASMINGKEAGSEDIHVNGELGDVNVNNQDYKIHEDSPNIVLRRKKKKERSSSSELRSNMMDKLTGLEQGPQSLYMNRNQQLSENINGRPKSLLVSWNNLLKRSSVRWRSSNHIIKGHGGRGGAQKINDNYSSGDESDEYSSSDDEILQELQVPVQFRQMHGPVSGPGTNDSIDGQNNGVSGCGPKRKDLSKFLGLDDSDSEEIVFIQNNKVPKQKLASNNDTFSSFESFSRDSHNSSTCHYINNGTHCISSQSSQTEVDSSSGHIVEPSIGCNDIENSSSPTNTASTSTTYHPTCHLPLRNPILDMLENDMDNFDPPPRKSVVFKDYGLFSVEESIAQGLPIIPFDSVNLSNDGKTPEKKKNQSVIGCKKKKKDAERRTSEIFLDSSHEVPKLQKNSRARSSSSESSLQVLFRNSRNGKVYEDSIGSQNRFSGHRNYEEDDHTKYRILRRGESDETILNIENYGSHVPLQMRSNKPPRRNENCKKTDVDKSITRSENGELDDVEGSSGDNVIRSNQLPVRSALRSPNSPPKRPCGPVVFGANSRRTISPIRKTSNKPGVTLAYLPPVAQPMVPAVYYHNHRYPVFLYGHHHPNMGYISHVEPSNGNFCRAFTRQAPPKGNSGTTQEKSLTNLSNGIKHTYGPRTNVKSSLLESKSSNNLSVHPGHKLNHNIQRPSHGNRPMSGHFVSCKPPRQRQMINPDNDHAAPPGEMYQAPDSNGTYVIMKNTASKKSSSMMTFSANDKNQLSNFL